jgi:hypothetical protein
MDLFRNIMKGLTSEKKRKIGESQENLRSLMKTD